jgi:nanoRNase/pAp phosphatase (c-di-AMP/oligoRNAs hydrolase)
LAAFCWILDALTPARAHSHARQLLRFLSRNRKRLSPLLILTHDFPDPDALASAWGLHHLARAFDIETRVVYGGVVSRAENRAMVKLLKMPIHKLKLVELERYANVALVDTQPKFENNPFPQDRKATIVIDQHKSSTEAVADLALVDTECGATCVIVAQALLLQRIDIPVKLATAIAYGILSDTLDLYRVKRADVIETYLSVLHRCDMRTLAEIQNPPRSRRFFTTLGRSIETAVAYRRVMVAHLGLVSSPEDVAQVADFLLTYEHASWSFCTGRSKGSLYLSLRTAAAHAQAGDVLRDIVHNPNQAGGHGGVAGGRIPVGAGASGTAWKAVEHLLQGRLAKRLRLPATAEFRRVFDDPAGKE